MKLMIEVSGGVVKGITATGDLVVYLVDYDNILEKAHADDARTPFYPDSVCDDSEFERRLDKALKDWEA